MAATTDGEMVGKAGSLCLTASQVEADAGQCSGKITFQWLEGFRMGGASKLGDMGLSRIAKCAPAGS